MPSVSGPSVHVSTESAGVSVVVSASSVSAGASASFAAASIASSALSCFHAPFSALPLLASSVACIIAVSGAAASNAAVESDVLPMLRVTSLASPTAIRQHAASAAIPAHRTGFFFCTGSSARAIRSSPTSPMARKSFSSLIRRSPPLRGTCAAFRASGTGWTSPCFPSCHTGLR